jgi:outer membrane protein assembly factor BamD
MKLRIRLVLIVFFLCFCSQSAYPYWIWTPKSKKWVNPKTLPKPTPKEQFDYAMTFYEIKSYPEARREFAKLLKAYPKAAEAAESQYYLGRIEEETGNIYEAFQAYQKVIDKYPFSERISEINEREFSIAERFMGGEKRKALGVTLPVDNPAIEIYQRVIDNSTYGPLAPKAQYKLGLLLKSTMRYYEAEDAFNKVISNYPNSEWAEASKYQIAATRAAVSRGPDYDQGAAKEAKEKFEEFVREHPEANLSQEAEKNISELNEKEAESNYNIGRFYEKQKQYTAAEVYYNDIINNSPRSPWAPRAMERLQIMEKIKK